MLYFDTIPVEVLRIILAISCWAGDEIVTNLETIPEFKDAIYSLEFWKLLFNYFDYYRYMEMGLFNKDLVRILQGRGSYTQRSPKDLFRMFSHEYNNIYMTMTTVEEILSHRSVKISVPLSVFSDYSILLDNIDITDDIFRYVEDTQMVKSYDIIEDRATDYENPITGRLISYGSGHYEETTGTSLTISYSDYGGSISLEICNNFATFSNGESSFYNLLLYVVYNKFRGIYITYNDL